MKKTILLLIILFCVTFFYAQQPQNEKNNPKCTKDYFNQAELVVECSLIKIVATYDTKGNRRNILALVAYKVQKVYKGDQSLTGSTVYLTEKGWNLGAENFPINSEGLISIPSFLLKNGIRNAGPYVSRIFFLTESEYPQTESSAKYALEKKYTQLGGIGKELYVNGNLIVGLDSLVFHNREDFHNYMRQFKGFTVPELKSR